MFKEQDYEWLKIIECMKRADMPTDPLGTFRCTGKLNKEMH